MKIRTMPIGRGPTKIPEGWRLYTVIPGYEGDVPTAVIVQDEDDDDYPVCGVCKDRHRPGEYTEDPS